jgi:hypothetical protein
VSFDTRSTRSPVSTWTALMRALATTAPCGSRTVPLISAVLYLQLPLVSSGEPSRSRRPHNAGAGVDEGGPQ